jgi:hypothetical protein
VSCHDAREAFPVLLAGSLSLTEWVEIEAHVRQCDGCGQALDHFYQVTPKDDAGRLRPPVSTARFARRLAMGAAAAVLMVGIGGYALQRRHDDQLTLLQSAPLLERLSSAAEPEAPSPAAAVSGPSAVLPASPAVTQSSSATVTPAARSMGSKMTSRSAGPKSSPASGTDVVVQLATQDRRGAERDLTSLLARIGGSRLARDQSSTMKVVVPRSRYREFTRGLAQIGSWQMETRSASLPDPVRVAVRLAKQ